MGLHLLCLGGRLTLLLGQCSPSKHSSRAVCGTLPHLIQQISSGAATEAVAPTPHQIAKETHRRGTSEGVLFWHIWSKGRVPEVVQSLREAHQVQHPDVECFPRDPSHYSWRGAPDHLLPVYAHLPRCLDHCGDAMDAGWSVSSHILTWPLPPTPPTWTWIGPNWFMGWLWRWTWTWATWSLLKLLTLLSPILRGWASLPWWRPSVMPRGLFLTLWRLSRWALWLTWPIWGRTIGI